MWRPHTISASNSGKELFINKTRQCDEHLFGKLAQTQVVINWWDTAASNVRQWGFCFPRFRCVIFGDVMSYNSLTTRIAFLANPPPPPCLVVIQVDQTILTGFSSWLSLAFCRVPDEALTSGGHLPISQCSIGLTNKALEFKAWNIFIACISKIQSAGSDNCLLIRKIVSSGSQTQDLTICL